MDPCGRFVVGMMPWLKGRGEGANLRPFEANITILDSWTVLV